jgi:hypothetical protein
MSIAIVKRIFKYRVSKLYGDIDIQFVHLTRFIEIHPGEFQYTCEILIPSLNITDFTKVMKSMNSLKDSDKNSHESLLNEGKDDILVNDGSESIYGTINLSIDAVPTKSVKKNNIPTIPLYGAKDTKPPTIIFFNTNF